MTFDEIIISHTRIYINDIIRKKLVKDICDTYKCFYYALALAHLPLKRKGLIKEIDEPLPDPSFKKGMEVLYYFIHEEVERN